MVAVNFISVLALAFAPAQDWPAVEKEAAGMLEQFVRIDTSNPPGDVTAAVVCLEKILKREGIFSLRYVADESAGRINLLARVPGTTVGMRPLLILVHLDTVPADPARWRFPPFIPAVRDGEMWGRGTLDMKGQLVIALETVLNMKRGGHRPERDIIMLFDCDEEAGGESGANWMVRHHYPDLNPEFVLDRGAPGSNGLYTTDGRTVFGVSVDEKKVLWIRLTATGDAGHGSMPGKRNAPAKLAQALAKISKLSFPPRDTAVVAGMRRRLGKLADSAAIRALERTTVTVTSLSAGIGNPPSVDTIPGTASATIDCRILPGEAPRTVLDRIKGCLDDPDLKLEVIHTPGVFPPQAPSSPLLDAIEAAVSAEVPGAVTVPILLVGETESRFFRERGAQAYGFEPMVRTAAEEELIHGDNERIKMAEFNRGLRIYNRLLRDFLKVPQ